VDIVCWVDGIHTDCVYTRFMNTVPKNSSDTLAQIAVIVAFVFTLVMNTLAVVLPLFGRSTKEISDSFPSFFTPAGYVFSIWSVLYLTQLVFTVYQALPAQASNPRIRAVRYPFVAACLFNGVWIIAWHGLIVPLSMVLMLGLLGSLVLAYNRLEIGVKPDLNPADRWLVRLPFSLYLGWITVATVANAVSLLLNLNWNGFGISGATWAAVLVLIAASFGIAFSLSRRDIGYNMVLLWAFGGIYVAQSTNNVIIASVALGALLILAAIVFSRLPGRSTLIRA
jgi:translocator protein